MPLYDYRPCQADAGCDYCAAGFEQLQKIADAVLNACPRCGAAVERVISAPHVVSGSAHVLQEKNYAKHGFTQYRKVDKGVYEKAGGQGPRYISDDGK